MTDAPHSNSTTSKWAAEGAEKGASTWRRAIFDFLEDRGEHGATDDEMQEHFDVKSQTQNPRRQELEKLGLVKKNGAVRLTRARKWAEVWVATPSDVVWPEDKPPKGMSKREKAYWEGYSAGYQAGLAAGDKSTT